MSEVISLGESIEEVYLPTYRTEPDERERLYPSKIKNTVEAVLQEQLTAETKYEEKEGQDLSKNIADSILQRLSDDLNKAAGECPSRYKLIVQAVIGQMACQGVRFASRCLWNVATDNYHSFSFTNDHLFCTVLVAGLYTD